MWPDPALGLLEIYDTALPQVYGNLLSRCRNSALAQDLTAETFLAAVTAARQQSASPISTGWLVGVARHKLIDHWRRAEREQRGLRLVHAAGSETDDPWDVEIDAVVAHQALDALARTTGPCSPCATSATCRSRRSPIMRTPGRCSTARRRASPVNPCRSA